MKVEISNDADIVFSMGTPIFHDGYHLGRFHSTVKMGIPEPIGSAVALWDMVPAAYQAPAALCSLKSL